MKMLILNGSSCSGKSSVAKHIMKQKEGYYHLSYDSIKWQFSQYKHGGKFYEDIHKVMHAILEVVCDLHYNVVTEAMHNASRQALIDIATSHGYETVEVNLEADFDILSKRFEERVANALANPESKISNTSKERFRKIFDTYEKEKNPSAITFKTEIPDVTDVAENILKLL